MGLNINSQSVNFTGSDNTGYALNLDALRLIRPSKNGQVVSVAGQEIAGDGFGNNYVWLDTATGTDDNSTVIVGNYSGTTGRWLVVNKELAALQEFAVDESGVVTIKELVVSESLTVPTTPTSDSSNNAASTKLVDNKLSNYLPLTGGVVTGPITGTTAPTSTNSGVLASTAYVQNNLSNYLPLTGGVITGPIKGVTSSTSDNSTTLASTAYVQNNLSNYLPLTGGVLSNQLTLDNTTNNQNVINFGKMGFTSQAILNFFTSGNTTSSDTNILVNGGNTTTGNEGEITITSGTINIQGNVTVNTPSSTDNSSTVANTQWVNSRLGDENIPAGIPLPWPSNTVPSGWMMCDGSAFDTTTYPGLYALYPTGKSPDLRGLFIRGYDPEGTYDIDGKTRGLLSTQHGSTLLGSSTGTVVGFQEIGSGNQTLDDLNWDNPFSYTSSNIPWHGYVGAGGNNAALLSELGTARPSNMAFNYIIKLI